MGIKLLKRLVPPRMAATLADSEKVAFLKAQGLQPSMSFPLLIDRYSSELMQFLRLACVTPSMGSLDDYKYSEMVSRANERACAATSFETHSHS